VLCEEQHREHERKHKGAHQSRSATGTAARWTASSSHHAARKSRSDSSTSEPRFDRTTRG
jgi:hypothetical protein